MLTATLLLVGALPVLAQAGQQPPQQQPPAPAAKAPAPVPAPAEAQAQAPAKAAPLSGELVRVDGEAKLLAIKTAAGDEVEFKYGDKTEVTGAKDGAAGLATMKEGQLTIHFTEDGQTKTKTATKIEVQPKKQQ